MQELEPSPVQAASTTTVPEPIDMEVDSVDTGVPGDIAGGEEVASRQSKRDGKRKAVNLELEGDTKGEKDGQGKKAKVDNIPPAELGPPSAEGSVRTTRRIIRPRKGVKQARAATDEPLGILSDAPTDPSVVWRIISQHARLDKAYDAFGSVGDDRCPKCAEKDLPICWAIPKMSCEQCKQSKVACPKSKGGPRPPPIVIEPRTTPKPPVIRKTKTASLPASTSAQASDSGPRGQSPSATGITPGTVDEPTGKSEVSDAMPLDQLCFPVSPLGMGNVRITANLAQEDAETRMARLEANMFQQSEILRETLLRLRKVEQEQESLVNYINQRLKGPSEEADPH